jgi:hypothetical protein
MAGCPCCFTFSSTRNSAELQRLCLVLRNVDCFVEAGLRIYRLVLHLENPLQAKKFRLVILIPVILRQARAFSTVFNPPSAQRCDSAPEP